MSKISREMLKEITKCLHKNTDVLRQYEQGCPQCQEIIYKGVAGMVDVSHTFVELLIKYSDNTEEKKEELLDMMRKARIEEENDPNSVIGHLKIMEEENKQ